jgi:Cu(I)/Ag(I) efflux system membrane protein CusA/SilA
MVERIIEWSSKHPLAIFTLTVLLALWSFRSIRETPLDAIPDLSDPQVIVFTEWMGRSPDLVEDQITYPLVRALRSTPGGVEVVRGYSMFGMSFVYVVFDTDVDIYWARTRVNEILPRVALPPGVTPQLGPDASGNGWVYEYVVVDHSGNLDAAQLRSLQDYTIGLALQAVDGVSEVASVGGFERQYQVIVNPNRLAAFGVSVGDVRRAVSEANSEVGARVLELAGREYVLRGRGYVGSLDDIESSVVTIGAGGTPIRVGDVARVSFGPDIRRGAADWNGQGEVVGGIVVMRDGSNALEVIDAVEQRIAELPLPEGVEILPAYDRSELIEGSIDTMVETVVVEGVIVALLALFFLFHARSAIVVVAVIPLAILAAFIPMHQLGLTANIMSLAGIAIAVGELEDASTTLVEHANTRLAEAGLGADRRAIIIAACKEVGRPTFFALLVLTVSFIPILTLTGQAGRLFQPLAYSFVFATFAAAILSVTLVPPLMLLVLRGKFRTEASNPIHRVLTRMYRPVVRLVIRARWLMVVLALVALGSSVVPALRLGSEFMPPLDEGSLLVMPVTFPGISIETAREVMRDQDEIIASFDEVATVFGKAGRAETATDPAQLEMIETVITLRPRDEWPLVESERWWSGAPDWFAPALRVLWPDQRPRTSAELANDIAAATATPGYQMAVAPPIRTRIDMLTTGVRTPVGIKVFGEDLDEIERISVDLERMLRDVPGTRSTFAERQSGREYIDVTPNREAIARYGLTVRQVHDVVEASIGGMSVSTIIAGRARYSVNVRFGADHRADVAALRSILVPVRAGTSPASVSGASGGSGTSSMGSSSTIVSEDMGGAMGGGFVPAPIVDASGSSQGAPDPSRAFAMPRPAVPLGELADIRVVTGPPMIRDEDGVLVGYVYADIDLAQRDLGGWVKDAKALVAEQLDLPAGNRLAWTGQYEFMEEMQDRMMWVVPLALCLVIALVRFAMRGWGQTLLVLTSLPFALVGSVWLLYLEQYNLSTAVWVGLIAVIGIAQETGILMIEALDESVDRRLRENARMTVPDLDEAIVDGASRRARPLAMSVSSTVLGLLPLMWESGPGADVSARIAAPLIGGLWTCMILTLLVLPAAYAIWTRHRLRRGTLRVAEPKPA